MSVNGTAKIINRKVLEALLALSERVKKRVAEEAGTLGQKIAHHVEHSNLDKRAWGIIAKLDALDPDRRARTLAHFDAYREQAEKGRWADQPTHYGDLAEMSDQEADEAEQEAAAARKAADADANAAKVNAAKLRNGIQPTPEQTEAAKTGKPVKVGDKAKGNAKGMPGAEGRATH